MTEQNQEQEADRIAGRIMVALDYAAAHEAERLLDALKGIPCYMKVGMQLYYAAGPRFVNQLKERGYRVFLDLKMHDIPNTVRGGAESITRLGVDMFNVHAAGGQSMMESALEGVDRGLASGVAPRLADPPSEQTDAAAGVEPGPAEPIKPVVIAVTQLTSTSQAVLNREIGIAGTVEEAVVRYAKLAYASGLAGVVASPWEVQAVKQACGKSFLTVTPGIRPVGHDAGDQSRVMTPPQAFAAGTDYIVVGRPITAAADPRQALEDIIASVLSSQTATTTTTTDWSGI